MPTNPRMGAEKRALGLWNRIMTSEGMGGQVAERERTMLLSSECIRAAERAAAEAMRERCAAEGDEYAPGIGVHIRALPLEAE